MQLAAHPLTKQAFATSATSQLLDELADLLQQVEAVEKDASEMIAYLLEVGASEEQV